MEKSLRRDWIVFGIGLLLGVAVMFVIQSQANGLGGAGNEVEREYAGTPLRATGDITCTYPQGMSAYYLSEKIRYAINPPEKEATVFTFSDIQEEVSKLKYIDATRTISETQLVKISEDDERIVFVEAGTMYIAQHTVFKESGISIFSKQATLLGIPSASTFMGTCIDS